MRFLIWPILLCSLLTSTSLVWSPAFGQGDAGTEESLREGGAQTVPDGQELVNIDFPEPTEIKDIIRAVALWTGKNVILGKGVNGKVQMISPRKVTKEEAYQAFLSALNVSGLTTVETGKIIKIMPVRSAVRGNLQIYQGSSWAPRTDKMITQIVPLRYIDAKKLQTTLSRIVSTNSMIAYQPTNTLIITDTGYKVRRILAIVELLDVQGQQPKVELVPIRYADAKGVAKKVGDILKASTKNKGTSGGFSGYRISVDERSNSVVIFGPPRTITDVKELVRKFDFPVEDPTNQAAIRVRFLDYADAKKLASTLSSLAQRGNNRRRPGVSGARTSTSRNTPRRTPTTTSKTDGEGQTVVADLGNSVKITADESSNALLITGSRSAYEAINNLVRKLDRRRAQVYLEADIIDMRVRNGFDFGTSILTGRPGERVDYPVAWQAGDLVSLLSSDDPNNISDTARTAAAAALGQNFTVGVLVAEEFTIPGIGRIRPGAFINMLKSDSNSRTLSSPHMLTSNNEDAEIKVGQKLFYSTAVPSAVANAGSVPQVQSEPTDLSLKIKPNISHSGGYVTLNIELDANDGTIGPNGLPDVNTRRTKQIVTVKNGQTAVISGLRRATESEVYSKIPLLGDVPIIGWLFRNSQTRREINNLVFFVTPSVVYGANDLAAVYKRKVEERDELMQMGFGPPEDQDGFFTSMMPSMEDGAHEPDEFDAIDDRERKQFLQDMREDMGYPMDNGNSGSKTEGRRRRPQGSLSFGDDSSSDSFDSFGDSNGPDTTEAPEPIEAPPPPPPRTSLPERSGGDEGGDAEDVPPIDE